MQNRYLHNADCNAMFYNPGQWQPEGGPYSAKALRRYVDRAADIGYDTFLYNPNVQVPLYPSRALRHKLKGYVRGDESFFRQASAAKNRRMMQMADLYLDLEEAGIDLLAEIAAACRERGMAPWLSIRMNDMHGWRNPEELRNCDLFRDPQFRRKYSPGVLGYPVRAAARSTGRQAPALRGEYRTGGAIRSDGMNKAELPLALALYGLSFLTQTLQALRIADDQIPLKQEHMGTVIGVHDMLFWQCIEEEELKKKRKNQ